MMPTRPVEERRQFRMVASQNKALINEAVHDKNHPYHSTAVHMQQEDALRRKPKLMQQALNDPNHSLHRTAQTVQLQNARRKANLRAALKDENHPLHGKAMAYRNRRQDAVIRAAQTSNPRLIQNVLANKNHPLYDSVQRVQEQDNRAAFAGMPYAS